MRGVDVLGNVPLPQPPCAAAGANESVVLGQNRFDTLQAGACRRAGSDGGEDGFGGRRGSEDVQRRFCHVGGGIT